MTTREKHKISLSEITEIIRQIAASSTKIINNDFDKFIHDCEVNSKFDLYSYENITCEEILTLKLAAITSSCKTLLILADILNIDKLTARDFWEFIERIQSLSICNCTPMVGVYSPTNHIRGALHLIVQR